MDDLKSEDAPSWLQLESVKPVKEAAEILGVSEDTVRRHYRDRIVKLSARRDGIKLRHILQIANGEEI